MVRAWTVRGGRHGQREAAALERSLVIAGWTELTADLSGCGTREEIRGLVSEFYSDESPATISNWTGQLYRFVHAMQIGDLVVMPRKHQLVVAVGRVVGNYQFWRDAEPGYQHVRPVEWLNTEVERSAIRGDLRDSMGSLLTVSELSRRGAVERVEDLAKTGIDPGYAGQVQPPSNVAELRHDIDESGTRQLSARDLIGLWDWPRRTTEAIQNVGGALAELGLSVEPHFTEVRLDDLVTVFDNGATDGAAAGADEDNEPDEPSLVVKDFTWRIGNVRQVTDVLCVTADKPLSYATMLLVEHEFSQLPVVDRHRRLLGVVTWESLARAQLSGRADTVAGAQAPGYPRTARDREELFARIPDIQQHGFVIVVDGVNAVTGILTAADLAGELQTRVEPFTVLEEIEQRLRRAVAPPRLTLDDLRSGFSKNPGLAKKINGPGDLTLGKYPDLVDACWSKLDWPFDRAEIVRHLRDVANYRNMIAHWNVDAPEDNDNLAKAQRLLRLLKVIDPDPII